MSVTEIVKPNYRIEYYNIDYQINAIPIFNLALEKQGTREEFKSNVYELNLYRNDLINYKFFEDLELNTAPRLIAGLDSGEIVMNTLLKFPKDEDFDVLKVKF